MNVRSCTLSLGVVALLGSLPFVAHAQSDTSAGSADGMTGPFGFNGILGGIGLVLPEDPVDATFGLEARANLGAPFSSAPQVIFMPGLGFWTGSDFTEFGILADVAYVVPTSNDSGIIFFVGGGLGLYFTSFDFEETFLGQTVSVSASDEDLGFSLLGGIAKEMSDSADIFGQLRFKFDGIDTINFFGGVQFRLVK